MRIYSAPSFAGIIGETFYSVNLPQIKKTFWQAPTTVAESAYLASSTASAGVFRQITKYDESAIRKAYSVVVSDSEAATLQAMEASKQTEWHVDTGAGLYLCIVTFMLAYEQGRAVVSISIAVLERVS